MRMMDNDSAAERTDRRYRALLDVSRAMVEQPTVKAVLHSFRAVLSSGCRLHGAHLYVLGNDGQTLHLIEFDREADSPAIKIGTKISRVGQVARVLADLEPVFLPDVSEEMLKHRELVPFAAESVGRPTYVFPVSTSHQRYGLLVVTKDRGQQFMPEDVELLRSLASHVAVALESAVARDNAERYQRQVVKERDRLRLLLEINNHIVSKLDLSELFRSAAASLRSYFGNDFAGLWLLDKQSNQLECAVFDSSLSRLNRSWFLPLRGHPPRKQTLALGSSLPLAPSGSCALRDSGHRRRS
jgi:GAF domain-containing protein